MEEKSVQRKNTNSYTFMFSIIMVVVVGAALAFAATSLQPMQYKNMQQEKMQSILATVGIETTRGEAKELYDKYIVEEIVLDNEGNVKEGVEAFDIDLAKEIQREPLDQNFPLYIAEVEGEKFFIVPLRGAGLWNAIFGYIAQEWFRERFVEEKVFDEQGNFIGVSVAKGTPSTSKDDNRVDAISGATITGNGVSDMISERLRHYLPYFKSETDMNVANN